MKDYSAIAKRANIAINNHGEKFYKTNIKNVKEIEERESKYTEKAKRFWTGDWKNEIPPSFYNEVDYRFDYKGITYRVNEHWLDIGDLADRFYTLERVG